MATDCNATDNYFPMKADIYFPIISQNQYAQPTKRWVFDRTVACNFEVYGRKGSSEITPDAYIKMKNILIGRIKCDPRISSEDNPNAISNILFTNIRTSYDDIIYLETAGPRTGKGTIYEAGTVEPFIDPYGDIQYYSLILRRTENQSVGE